MDFEEPFDDWVFSQDTNKTISFSFSIELEKTDQSTLDITSYVHDEVKGGNPVLFMLGLKKDWPKLFNLNGFIEYNTGKPLLTISKVEIPNDHTAYKQEPILFDRKVKHILALKPGLFRDDKVWGITSYSRIDEKQQRLTFFTIGQAVRIFLHRIYEKVFTDLIIYIPAIRIIQPIGDDIIESLSKLRDGVPRKRQLEKSVITYIKSLIFTNETQEFSFVYPEDKGKHRIKIQIGELQLPLTHYGSSVEQMLSLAAIIIKQGNNKIILMEEPEAHFHPFLQRNFIKFLFDNQKIFNHQYLIASHSSLFINEFVKAKSNIYHVYTEGGNPKYTQIEPFNRNNVPSILNELGVKPADIFFANGLLIVEGRIDKEIYTNWANNIGKSFQDIDLEVIDVIGAGNIKKYLESPIIQKTSFSRYVLCDKIQEETMKKQLNGLIPDKNFLVLQKGDIEDYYPRKLVLEFAMEFGIMKNINIKDIPTNIKVGETVETLNTLLGEKWWKLNLEQKILKEMKLEEIDEEVINKITKIYDSIR
jgi:hypothetical protein